MNENVLTGARLLSKAITEIYDSKLRPFGISAIQFSLLDIIRRTEPATRARIARLQQLDKSTLTRNLRSILSEGWAEEVAQHADGRSRPIALTKAGMELLLNAQPACNAALRQVEALLGEQGITAVRIGACRIARMSEAPVSGANPVPPI